MTELQKFSKRMNKSIRDDRIDKGLDYLCSIQKPGETFTLEEIAEVCGCSRQNIHNIQASGMRKIRKQFRYEDF